MGAQIRNYDVVKISGTTTSGGAAADDSPNAVTGKIIGVWVDGTNLSNGADLTLNAVYTDVDGVEILGENIINNADVGNATLNEFYPRRAMEDTADADLLFAAAGTIVPTEFAVFEAKLRVTIANGGNAVAYAVRVLMEV